MPKSGLNLGLSERELLSWDFREWTGVFKVSLVEVGDSETQGGGGNGTDLIIFTLRTGGLGGVLVEMEEGFSVFSSG